VVVGLTDLVKGQMLDEVRDPAPGKRLVGAADPEHQTGTERTIALGPQHRQRSKPAELGG
jgi:hypothetical protein